MTKPRQNETVKSTAKPAGVDRLRELSDHAQAPQKRTAALKASSARLPGALRDGKAGSVPTAPRPVQPARSAVKSKRPAAPGPGSLSASAKQHRIAEMLRDIRSGIAQLSSNADILRGRFS